MVTFGGRLSGLVGTYLLLLMVLLIGRIPLFERTVGQDRLVRWHRQLGPWPICLLVLHAILITAGYAAADRTGLLHEFWLLLTTYPDVLGAAVALGLMIMAGVVSFRAARRRLRYETWWAIHLYTYLALALAFAHQLANGASFVGHPLARAVWTLLWAATAGTVLVARVGLPVWRTIRHRLRVVEVREEGPGVVSVICSGRKLDRLAVSGGQFFQWRFLVRELWWQAHPYSLSALPRPPYLRVTVKGLGDQSHAVARIPKGTRVAIEGPYGLFTDHARRHARVLLVAAGVGITPIRALLEDLPPHVDVAVILRGTRPDDLILRDEVAALVNQRPKAVLHEVVGPSRSGRPRCGHAQAARPRRAPPGPLRVRPGGLHRPGAAGGPVAVGARRPDPRGGVRVLMKRSPIVCRQPRPAWPGCWCSTPIGRPAR